jgi:hypothetical protein
MSNSTPYDFDTVLPGSRPPMRGSKVTSVRGRFHPQGEPARPCTCSAVIFHCQHVPQDPVREEGVGDSSQRALGVFQNFYVTFMFDLRSKREWARWIPLIKRTPNPLPDPSHTLYIVQGCGVCGGSHPAPQVWTTGSYPLEAGMFCRPPTGMGVGAMNSYEHTEAKYMFIFEVH